MRYLKSGLMVISIISSLIACQKAEETQLMFDENKSGEVGLMEEFVTTEGQTVLGDVIDIPYSIENLLKAYENLPAQTKSQIDPNDIKPTHYYVRFYPKAIEELDILRNIKPYVFLSETPLDRKVVVGGSSYHDPSIPEDLPTFQYTVVPVDRWVELEKTVPIEAEILVKAYIPDYDEAYTTKSEDKYGIPTSAYEALLKEAYRITGNEYDSIPETKASWTPTGRIRAYDNNVSSYLPIKNVRVRGTHLLKVKEALTDSNGYFTLPSFNNPVNMRVVWESDQWDIRLGAIGQATFDGPTLNNQSWNLDIGTEHPKNIRYAAMHRAAYRYYYDSVQGLYRPDNSRKEKLCFYDSYNSGKCADYWGNIGAGILPDIRVFGKDSDGEYRSTDKIFQYTIHELAHAAHCTNMGSNVEYYFVKSILYESWADYVEWVLTNHEYNSLGGLVYISTHQSWNSSSDNLEYSSLFFDLNDTYNQGLNNNTLIFDSISGFTNANMNYALIYSSNLSNLKENLKTVKPFGVTNSGVDSLLVQYELIWANRDN